MSLRPNCEGQLREYIRKGFVNHEGFFSTLSGRSVLDWQGPSIMALAPVSQSSYNTALLLELFLAPECLENEI